MDRRTFVSGAALCALSKSVGTAQAHDLIGNGSSNDEVGWRRYAAKKDGRRPSVILLHGMRGFDLRLPAYERYADALTAASMDAYLVEYYAPHDGAALKAMASSAEREAYERPHYIAWSERVSSVITAILKSDVGSDRIGLLGFSLGGFVAATTASRDSRVSALAVLYGGMPSQIAPQVKHMPPVIELHGEADRNVSLAAGTALVKLAKAVGASAEQVTYPGKGHGFDFADNDPAAGNAVNRITQFFEAQLGTV